MGTGNIVQDYIEEFEDITQIEDNYEFKKNLNLLKKGIRADINTIIEVNDIDVRARIIKKPKEHKNIITPSLVIEEEGSVRWYQNPDLNSDKIVRKVFAKIIGRR